jgi:DNA-binding NarL/FixJ family response regulator
MIIDAMRGNILVLSDNDGLSRAIELNLNNHLDVEVIKLTLDSEEQWTSRVKNGNFDLIVLGLSSPTSEPIVALARASLTRQIGKVPLLIISDRVFESDIEKQIIHLDFPFTVDKLRDKVKTILQAGQGAPASEVLEP